ncbi:MAG TPA: hypothetical protein PLQ36_00895 [Candidatus Gracilibacteria bacterium]|nr:hypothetical protein [Candidatus Gracilibacteria bacterium]
MKNQNSELSSTTCQEENLSSQFQRKSFLSGAIFGVAVTLVCTITLNLITPSLMSASLISKNPKPVSIEEQLKAQTLAIEKLSAQISKESATNKGFFNDLLKKLLGIDFGIEILNIETPSISDNAKLELAKTLMNNESQLNTSDPSNKNIVDFINTLIALIMGETTIPNSKGENLQTPTLKLETREKIAKALSITINNYDLKCLTKASNNKSFSDPKAIANSTKIASALTAEINKCQKSDSKLEKISAEKLSQMLNSTDNEVVEILGWWGSLEGKLTLGFFVYVGLLLLIF